MDEAIPIWLEYADADISTAEFLYEKQWPRQLEIICYYCQQAGEKAVKALYLAADIPGGIPQKHDLWFLLEQIKERVDVPESILRGRRILCMVTLLYKTDQIFYVQKSCIKNYPMV